MQTWGPQPVLSILWQGGRGSRIPWNRSGISICQTKLVKFSWVHGLNPFMNHLSNTYLRLPTKNHLFGRFFAIGLRLNVNTILLEPTDSNEDHDNGRGVSARLCWPLLLAWTAWTSWTAWTFVSWVDRVKRPSDSPCLVLNRSKQFSFFLGAWHSGFSPSRAHIGDKCPKKEKPVLFPAMFTFLKSSQILKLILGCCNHQVDLKIITDNLSSTSPLVIIALEIHHLQIFILDFPS